MPGPSRSAVEALRPIVTSPAFAQLVRFAVAGVGVTLLSALIYIGVAVALRVDPLLANALSHATGIVAGYAIHSRWSFRSQDIDRDDGDSDGGDSDGGGATVLRFTIASGFSFALNSLWVWLATAGLHLPAWSPVPAMVFVTPLASFAINRYWVFRAA
jgi:putative flippase GtrA